MIRFLRHLKAGYWYSFTVNLAVNGIFVATMNGRGGDKGGEKRLAALPHNANNPGFVPILNRNIPKPRTVPGTILYLHHA